jgi:hypothetical protein
VDEIPIADYISEGAEQKVYLKDTVRVTKLNDAIFYASWLDYFHSLLLHNYFFADTAYQLKGLFQNNNVVFAVVEQPFVRASEKTDLQHVKLFLGANGFINFRNNDYRNLARIEIQFRVAADKWIKLFCQIKFAKYSSLKNLFSIIHFSNAQENRIEIQLAESFGKQPCPSLRLRLSKVKN